MELSTLASRACKELFRPRRALGEARTKTHCCVAIRYGWFALAVFMRSNTSREVGVREDLHVIAGRQGSFGASDRAPLPSLTPYLSTRKLVHRVASARSLRLINESRQGSPSCQPSNVEVDRNGWDINWGKHLSTTIQHQERVSHAYCAQQSVN